ncbi:putative phosphatidate phosphatase [Periplaneta americana]|uniref:putative phosphatidate phosphatase n=1 Tax=Periplaneta americana TaxID=6978 RepID=UPI0037E98785
MAPLLADNTGRWVPLSHSGETAMATRRFSFRGASADIACIVILGIFSLVLYLFDNPFERGFFCDDESIRYPLPSRQTVSDVVVGVVGVGLPVLVILVTEILRAGFANPTSMVLFGWTPKVWMVQCYAQVGAFLFGAGAQLTIVEAAKRMVGRLRPHFMEACRPLGVKCDNMGHEYITDFTCSGDPAIVKEARLSFPSGHAAVAFYAATFLIMYLQTRMTWECSKLLKHLLQFLAMIAAWATALSRVSDYMHHWSDVLAGIAIGTLVGILTILYVSNLHRKKINVDGSELMTLMKRPNNGYSATDIHSKGPSDVAVLSVGVFP